MAINLADKYSKQIDQVYTNESFVAGKANTGFEFTGVKAVKVMSPKTVKLVDYQRSGTNRYGDPKDMENDVQEMTVTQDKGFSLVIDKGNSSSANGTFAAGARLKQQMREQVTPEQDKHAIAQYIKHAGKVAGISKPTKATILEMLSDAGVAMDNESVPAEGRYCFIGASLYGTLRLADAVVSIDKIGVKAVSKGVMGEAMGFMMVKVPDSYLPSGAYFLCYHPNSVVNPHKIQDAKIHRDPPGISGDLLEGRFLYDAFVLDKKSGGVYAAVDSAKKQAAPTISVSGTTATITSADATSIKVTTDGSDPRYSDSAVTIQTGGTVTVGASYTVKAVAYGTFTSDVAEKTK